MSKAQTEFDPSALDEVEFDSGGADQRALQGRDRVDKSGFYHLYVSSIAPQNDSAGAIVGVKLGLVVMAGTVADQVGAKFDHFVNFRKKDGTEVADQYKKQTARLVRALDLAPEAEILAGTYRAKWSQVTGRQFFAKVVVKPDQNGQDRAQIDFGQAWKPGDEAARKIPAHIESLQSAGYPVEGQASFVASQASGSSESPDINANSDIPF